MKLMKHCVTALFSIIIGFTSYAQSEPKKAEIKEDSIYHMKNHGVLTYERKVPECDFVEKKGSPSKIVCAHTSGGGKQDSPSFKTRSKAERANAKASDEDEGMVKNDSKNGFNKENKK